MRKNVNRKKDRKIFKKTAMKTNERNIPGHIISRGGTRL